MKVVVPEVEVNNCQISKSQSTVYCERALIAPKVL